jgi:hypothetical protein
MIPLVPLGHGKSRDFKGISSFPADGTNVALLSFDFVFATVVVVTAVIAARVVPVVFPEFQSPISWIAGGLGKMTDRFLSSSFDFMSGNWNSIRGVGKEVNAPLTVEQCIAAQTEKRV